MYCNILTLKLFSSGTGKQHPQRRQRVCLSSLWLALSANNINIFGLLVIRNETRHLKLALILVLTDRMINQEIRTKFIGWMELLVTSHIDILYTSWWNLTHCFRVNYSTVGWKKINDIKMLLTRQYQSLLYPVHCWESLIYLKFLRSGDDCMTNVKRRRRIKGK